ncbi:MAG: arsenic efflux protein [Erysipelotrichia bacterium]|nr:arsenic efflux protein [Erysipelotrichia bacterium]
MTWDLFLDILLHSIVDSLLVFVFVFIFHVILSFIEQSVSNFLIRRKKAAPVFGAFFGLVPQCGTSVMAADLYMSKYITVGTLIAVFLASNDEALLILLTAWNEKTLVIFPLIGLKILVGASIGIIVDFVVRRQPIKDVSQVEAKPVCCHGKHHEKTPLHDHLIHPLNHALKILIYLFVINLALGLVIGFVGEQNFIDFMALNKYLAPLFAAMIGLIPNCASSVLITGLFLSNTLSFGAFFAGLLVNAGIGFTVLFKQYKNIKSALLIIGFCFIVAVIFGYATCLITGF